MKSPPKDVQASLVFCESAVCTSRCSGAMRFVIAMAASMSGASTAKPLRTAGMATSLVGRTASCLRRAAFTLAMTPASAVTRIGRASVSCSAWASRSAAITSGSAVLSARTSTSLGPASMSMPQKPFTMDLAAVTHLFPGPTMMSQAATPGTDPYAMAAIACAPPTATRQSAPATKAAPLVTSDGLGEATMTSATPAARAVHTVISTEEGKGYLPPGA
mmetsp:Transcript_40042/g.87432  ORF Transcript_40042/g.87432 Transcript_40042/m.87432 type:complete len:218 (-) Transcript_40042:487-1140(-)